LYRAVTDRPLAAGAVGFLPGFVGAACLALVGLESRPSVEPDWIRLAGSVPRNPMAGLNSCWAVERDIRQVRAEVDLALRTMEDVRVRVEGVPIPWSEVTRPQFLPEAFESAMAETQAKCPDVDLLRVDCEEPPCIVWVRPRETDMWDVKERVAADSEVLKCGEWGRRYAGYEGGTVDVDCDGTQVHGVMWATPRSWTFESEDPDFEANVAKRIRTRMAAARENWPCPQDP
jgi:hypothetical protein